MTATSTIDAAKRLHDRYDRAAFGGVGAKQLRTAKARGFSHSNVKRVGELIEQQKDLRQKLGIKN